MEFLVHMELKLPETWSSEWIKGMYRREAETCRPYLGNGMFARVWREPGTRNHWALWDVPDVQMVHDAYVSFPMFPWMTVTVHPLAANPNDPGRPASEAPDVTFTYAGLLAYYEAHVGTDGVQENGDPSESLSLTLAPGVSIHRHPHSQAPREFHVMVDGVKIAEVGPDKDDPGYEGEAKAPGYVDLLGEWIGQPVHHQQWQRRVLRDNDLLHPDYQTALAADRRSWF